ncbi:MAG TPA: hypothetical protein VHF51_04365 [Solirubrobacteraceae bacterium]|nr:hypothetical protein [Solirubrobacteraceae bacterium]
MIHPARAATTAARGPRPPRRRGRLPAHRPRGPPARRHAPLWEDHITWTRLAIVSFAGSLPDLSAIQARLLRNQSDIAAAIRPDYGRSAERRLRTLLREHITGAVTLLGAAKGGDTAAVGRAQRAWYANANEIADFLSGANPRHWPRGETRAMMKTHLDLTLKEAVDRLNGRFDADVLDYEAVHRSILEMADMLRDRIVAQSPERFR